MGYPLAIRKSLTVAVHVTVSYTIPGSKVHEAIMGPTWGWQDPGGPHEGHVNFAIRDIYLKGENRYFDPKYGYVYACISVHTQRWNLHAYYYIFNGANSCHTQSFLCVDTLILSYSSWFNRFQTCFTHSINEKLMIHERIYKSRIRCCSTLMYAASTYKSGLPCH